MMLPPLPMNLLQHAFERFFEDADVSSCDGRFAKAAPSRRAELLVDFLRSQSAGGNSSARKRPRAVSTDSLWQACLGTGSSVSSSCRKEPGRQRRVLVTGCFDLMHAGHYNALRQAKAVFGREDVTLVAGVHADDAIEGAKGAPAVLSHNERMEIVQACRWVDEVVGELPYEVPVSLLDRLQCDVAVHGDDLPTVTDGKGLFDELIAAKRLLVVKRTEGTSTTVLIGRLLSMSKDHLQRQPPEPTTPILIQEGLQALPDDKTGSCDRGMRQDVAPRAHEDHSLPVAQPLGMLLPTMSRISSFYGEHRRRLADATCVVYAPGEFDLFHIGHIRFLERARKLGDFLVVGLLDDATIHRKKGRNFPLQTLHERALALLACKHVDDVLLGASWKVTPDILKALNVSVVATGNVNIYAKPFAPGVQDPLGLGDPFEVLREPRAPDAKVTEHHVRLRIVESETTLTMDEIADRIFRRTEEYAKRQQKKEQAEADYNARTSYVAES
eukprot:TRINITY_DN49454_c0_g1_i1.p1 TRINITY_DN49454_c0_g1~~TRINITY_DN49454_c0_g1_i1.p1  ORF type:complete len:499 (-),score=107.53 TRINITY_DN49454_c0_g1_i1:112-1608(-)